MDQCDDKWEVAWLAEQYREREARRLLEPENYQPQLIVSRYQQGPDLLGFPEDPEILNVLRTSKVLRVHTTEQSTARRWFTCRPSVTLEA